MAEKGAGLRLFADAEAKMNLGLADVGGGVLVVSQFTLYGDAQKGRRPSFITAARPETAIPLYERFLAGLRGHGLQVETCLLYTSPSPRDRTRSRMPSSA